MLSSIVNKIIELDFYSNEVQLKIQNGKQNFKTWFGGIISFFTLLLIIASIIFFLNNFFSRKEATIITNNMFTTDVKIENFSKYPFMIRVSDSNGVVKENPSRVWKFILSYWWTEKNLTDPSKDQVQNLEFIDMIKCDINNERHFSSEFKDLFKNQTDLDSFMCPDYKKNYSLIGVYGDTNPFSYLHFYLRPCIKNIDNIECESDSSIKSYMSAAYLDFRTINYAMNSYLITPYQNIVHSERFLFSNTIFRRIWMYYKKIYYNSDFGYIFEEITKTNFFQIDSYKNDIDIRVVSASGTVPFSFLRMTLSNLNSSSEYSRTYTKAQNFLANVGGIIRGLTLIGFIINYSISEKLFNLHLINHLPEIGYIVNQTTNKDCFTNVKQGFIEVKKSDLKLIRNLVNNNLIERNENLKNNDLKMEIFKDHDNSSNNLYTRNNDKAYDENIKINSKKIQKVSVEYNNYLSKINNMSLKNDFFNNSNDEKNEKEVNNNTDKLSDDLKKNNKIEDKLKNTNGEKVEKNNISESEEKIVEEIDIIRLSKYEKYINPEASKLNIDLPWYQYFIPDILSLNISQKYKIYCKALDLLNQELDIANIINRLNQFEKIKESILTYDQFIIFNYLFQSKNESDKLESKYYHNIDSSEYDKSIAYTLSKKKKDYIDEYLLSNIIYEKKNN